MIFKGSLQDVVYHVMISVRNWLVHVNTFSLVERKWIIGCKNIFVNYKNNMGEVSPVYPINCVSLSNHLCVAVLPCSNRTDPTFSLHWVWYSLSHDISCSVSSSGTTIFNWIGTYKINTKVYSIDGDNVCLCSFIWCCGRISMYVPSLCYWNYNPKLIQV